MRLFEALFINGQDPFLGQGKPEALFTGVTSKDAPNKGAKPHRTRSPFDKAQVCTQLYSWEKRGREFPFGVLKPFLIAL